MAIKKLKLQDLGRKSIADFKRATKYPIILVLDNIRSAFNVGSIFRTADAFLIEKIILLGYTPSPKDEKNILIQKTALNATKTVNWEHQSNDNICNHLYDLKKKSYKLVVLEQTNQSMKLSSLVIQPQEKIILVCGNEIQGVSQSIIDMADVCVEIEQKGTKHSLNVGVATAICLWKMQQALNI